MFENLMEFFISTYTNNRYLYGIQAVAVMSLAGILLGLVHQLFLQSWKDGKKASGDIN